MTNFLRRLLKKPLYRNRADGSLRCSRHAGTGGTWTLIPDPSRLEGQQECMVCYVVNLTEQLRQERTSDGRQR